MILDTIHNTIIPLFTPLLPPLHLLAFSTLLGTQLFQTIAITRVTFASLPRGPFIRLQKSLWPVYFRLQLVLFISACSTFPPTYAGKALALVIGGVAAGLNSVWAGPWARRVMLQRSEIGLGKNEFEESGADMLALNRSFKTSHAMSIHLNLISIGATLWHGWNLACRLQF